MHRRSLFAAALAAGGLFGVRRAAADAPAREAPDPRKAVYHLSDSEKVLFVLGNIHNHFEGAGADKLLIELVVHGPALKPFHAAIATSEVKQRLSALPTNGLTLTACAHTMRAQHVTPAELLPGFTVAEQGGVVRIAELQGKGYVYLRP